MLPREVLLWKCLGEEVEDPADQKKTGDRRKYRECQYCQKKKRTDKLKSHMKAC